MSRRGMLIAAAVAAAAIISVGVFVALGAPGGGSDGEPVPEALRGLGSPTIEMPPTPAPVTPTPAAQAGRDDCPQDWAVYQDPDGYFSLCYPADWTATAGPAPPHGAVLSLTSPRPTGQPTDVSLTAYWDPSGKARHDLTSDRCAPVSHWEDLQEVSLTMAEGEVLGCAGDTTEVADAPPREDGVRFQGTFAEVPVQETEGVVVLFLTQVEGRTSLDTGPLSTILQPLRTGP